MIANAITNEWGKERERGERQGGSERDGKGKCKVL